MKLVVANMDKLNHGGVRSDLGKINVVAIYSVINSYLGGVIS